jgi:hypothetical protein
MNGATARRLRASLHEKAVSGKRWRPQADKLKAD